MAVRAWFQIGFLWVGLLLLTITDQQLEEQNDFPSEIPLKDVAMVPMAFLPEKYLKVCQ